MGILFRAKYKEEPYFGGKYFRIVGRLVADGNDISKMLIEKQLAVPYGGGKKTKDWCGDPFSLSDPSQT